MDCLDEQTVVAFVTGALAGRRLAEAEHHLLGCADCATLVGFAASASAARLGSTLEWAGAPPLDEKPGPGPAVPRPGSRAPAPGLEGAATQVINGTHSWQPDSEADVPDFDSS